MATVVLILLVVAFVLFVLGIRGWFGDAGPRLNLIAAGLACWVLTEVLIRIP